jgi:hypothetical protein
MSTGRIYATVAVAALLLALGGCGRSAPGAAPSAPTLTVSGKPSDRVTDVAARALTKKEVAEIIKNCTQAAGIPGVNSDCDIPRSFQGSYQPCTPASPVCLVFGRVKGNLGVGVLQILDQRPGGSACSDAKISLCHGITVPAQVVAPLSTATPTAVPTSGPASGPASGSASPTSSEPVTPAPTLPAATTSGP